MIFNTDEAIFKKSKERYANLLNGGYVDKFDAPSVAFIKAINEHENISTVFSCSGHVVTSDEDDNDAGYVMLVTKNDASLIFIKFFEKIRNLKPAYRSCRLEFCSAYNIFTYGVLEEFYDCIVFRTPTFTSEEIITNFWVDALEVYKQVSKDSL